MGLGALLLLPVTAPVRGFWFLAERLHDEAEAVLRDEGRVFAELTALGMRHRAGQLSDAEHAEQETELFERLSSIREYWNELRAADAPEGETGDDEGEEEW